MKHPRHRSNTPRRLAGALAALLAAGSFAACHHSHGSPRSTPVFFEAEVNDLAFEANYFGVLRPGDHFFIDGHISDSGFDPYDSFEFTSGEPVHVDFALWIDDPFADVDVCVYDPVLDADVGCFLTPDNPELGGVDATASGLDFQLVVLPYSGHSTYSLEITVYSPASIPATAAGASPPLLSAPGSSSEHEKGADAGSIHGHRLQRPAIIGSALMLGLDPETGDLVEREFVQTFEGVWVELPLVPEDLEGER